MRLRLLIVAAAASVLGLLLLGQNAAAQEREEITMSPAQLRVGGEPGAPVSGKFKVANTGEVEFEFKVYANPYSVTNESYQADYENEAARGDAHKWVSFDITSGTLAPREIAEISYTITPPDNATPGSHYGVIFAETVPPDNAADVVVRAKRVGSVVRLNVAGDTALDGRTESIQLPSVWWQSSIVAGIRVENTGNTEFDARTTLKIETLLGGELYNDEKTHAVFPGYPRYIEQDWGGNWRFGLYRATVTSDVLGEQTIVKRWVLLLPAWLISTLSILAIATAMYVGFRHLQRRR